MNTKQSSRLLGQIIQKGRQDLFITQEDFAIVLSTTTKTIELIEAGEKRIGRIHEKALTYLKITAASGERLIKTEEGAPIKLAMFLNKSPENPVLEYWHAVPSVGHLINAQDKQFRVLSVMHSITEEVVSLIVEPVDNVPKS